MVDLTDLLMFPEYQIREEKVSPRDDAVKRYMGAYRAGKALPPILVKEHNAGYILIDGWHRVAALHELGERTVEAEIVQDAQLEDIRWLAGKANLTHGKPMRPKEYRAIFRAYIDAGQHREGETRLKSYREISADLEGARGVSTLHGWMKADYPEIAARMAGEELKPLEPMEPPRGELLLYVYGMRALETVARMAKVLSSEEHRGNLVKGMLETLVMAAGTLTSEDRLGEVIETLEITLGRLKAKPYRPHDSSAF
jgi:hypothetical protein